MHATPALLFFALITLAEPAVASPSAPDYRPQEPSHAAEPPMRGWGSFDRAATELSAAMQDLHAGWVSQDSAVRQTAWRRYLERVEAIESDLRNRTVRLPFVVSAIEGDTVLLESRAFAKDGSPLRVLVGRPAGQDIAGSVEGADAELDALGVMLTRSLLGGLLQKNTPAREGGGWRHVLQADRLPGIEVGTVLTLDVRCRDLAIRYLHPDHSSWHSIAEVRRRGPTGDAEARFPLGNNWGAWFVIATWADSSPSDRFGRTSPCVGDLVIEDCPTSDWVCQEVGRWKHDLELDAKALEQVGQAVDAFGTEAWKSELEQRLRQALPSASGSIPRAPHDLTRWLAWVGDAELLGLLWSDQLLYTPDSFGEHHEKRKPEFWRQVRRDLQPDLALFAIAGGSGSALNLLTDDVIDPFAPIQDASSPAHFAFAFGELSMLQQLTAERYLDEVRERRAYLEGLVVVDHPFLNPTTQWVNWELDARPAWLREQYPPETAKRDALLALQAGTRVDQVGARATSLSARRTRYLGGVPNSTGNATTPVGVPTPLPDPQDDWERKMFETFYKSQNIFPKNAGGTYIINHDARDKETGAPAWTFEGKPMLIRSAYDTIAVPVVPFAPDWLEMSPQSTSGLRPADYAMLFQGVEALERLQASACSQPGLAAPTFVRYVDSIPQFVPTLNAFLKSSLPAAKEFASARRRLGDALSRLIRARKNRDSIANSVRVERNALVERLQELRWRNPALYLDPKNPNNPTNARLQGGSVPPQPAAGGNDDRRQDRGRRARPGDMDTPDRRRARRRLERRRN